jgi:nicotinamidase-related amidase
MKHSQKISRRAASVAGTLGVLAGFFMFATHADSIIDEWDAVKTPPPPKLQAVNIDPASSALIVMDISVQSCTAEKRPRCVAMLPKVKKLIAEARAQKMWVLYTLAGNSKKADIIKDVAPLDDEQVLSGAGPDKFVGIELESMLKDRHIKTLIAVGTAAEGAVLHTAAGAAFRGFEVVVPVDAMSSTNPYAEQYTAWHLANAPRLADHVKLTKADMLKF